MENEAQNQSGERTESPRPAQESDLLRLLRRLDKFLLALRQTRVDLCDVWEHDLDCGCLRDALLAGIAHLQQADSEREMLKREPVYYVQRLNEPERDAESE